MGKTKTSVKQKKYSVNTSTALKIKAGATVKAYDPTKALANETRIAKAIWECLKDGDHEGVVEILEAHLMAVNKLKFSREANIPRATLYHSFRSKNPSLKTLAKIIHAAA